MPRMPNRFHASWMWNTISNERGKTRNLQTKIVDEIKARKGEIKFENGNIIGQILDKEHGKEFDVDKLKVYELIPTECTERQ